MKYVLSILGVAVAFVAIFCCRASSEAVVFESDYIRIHIVASSSQSVDVQAQYLVKDSVVEFLIPLLSEAESSEQALAIVEENLTKINEVARSALASLDLEYGSSCSIVTEYVPMRAYENMILSEGDYCTLRIELGAGEGDNWWCVVFPAVCFLDTSNPENFEYVSKIWQIIQSVVG